MGATRISIQTADFDLATQHNWLTENNLSDGAVVTFVGLVRDMNQGNQVQALELEHYPGMAEKSLNKIIEDVRQRWSVGNICVIHRVGRLELNDNIVFVGVTSKHRQASFLACQFIMDFLKTQVPIWKKEWATQGAYWVESKEDNAEHQKTWLKSKLGEN